MRIRVFLFALVGVLMVCLPLAAAEDTHFSVGIFALEKDSAPLLQLVEEAGTSYANQFLVPSETYLANLEKKKQKDAELSTLESISSAYASKSEKALEKAREAKPQPFFRIPERLDITYTQIPFHEGYAKLLDTFTEARSWYASQGDYDALLLIKKTSIASNERIRLYWYDLSLETTTLIFDQMMVQNDSSALKEKIGVALLAKSAGTDYALVIFDNYNSSVTVKVNGEPLDVKGRQELFTSGVYTVNLSEKGYVPKQIELQVLPNSIVHLPSSLERLEVGPIRLSSSVGKLDWFADGLYLGTHNELSINSSMVPLVVVAHKQGFANKTLQLQKPVQEITLSLEPEWMKSSALIKDEQKSFYASLRNTMLIFGLYVASTTLSHTFEVASPLWQPLQVATSGFALVSTVHTIMNLASYASLAGSGIR